MSGNVELRALVEKWRRDAMSDHERCAPLRETSEGARVVCNQAYTKQECADELEATLASTAAPAAHGGEVVYQWLDYQAWNDMSREEYELVHASPGNFVRGETIIYPHMTRVLYTVPQEARAEGVAFAADEREWLEYAVAHMLDDDEPEDKTCAAVLQRLLDRTASPEPPTAAEESDDANSPMALIIALAASVGADVDGGELPDSASGYQGYGACVTFSERQLEQFVSAIVDGRWIYKETYRAPTPEEGTAKPAAQEGVELPPLPGPTAFLYCKGSDVTARAWNVNEMRNYARAAIAMHGGPEPRAFREIRQWMEHCVSAADEGVEYGCPREVLDALTTLRLMEKCGRGKG